uniref:aldo-keto reductase family 1 member B15-like n=1 Tax=Oncorhynchus gorbuscha TaxID=8017 RepID=UPI001EAEEC67|nr:aldo-keto reductase family 1 member B15-like [Oncorhynchus gorbuscha]XP_046201359.1 aldo-keto reductase family 1 member B15-like [Oncorhynchus gorbuscha]
MSSWRGIHCCRGNQIPGYLGAPLGKEELVDAGVKPDNPCLFQDSNIKDITDKHQRTISQVLLRFLVQSEVCVIPKSTTPQHMYLGNLQVFDFELSKEDIRTMLSLNRNYSFSSALIRG